MRNRRSARVSPILLTLRCRTPITAIAIVTATIMATRTTMATREKTTISTEANAGALVSELKFFASWNHRSLMSGPERAGYRGINTEPADPCSVGSLPFKKGYFPGLIET